MGQIRCICLVLPFAEWMTVILYIAFILKNGHRQWMNMKEGRFDNGFPLTGRHRLYITRDVNIRGVCAFMLMPIGFLIGPCMVLIYLGSLGHKALMMVTISTLCIGWGLRMFERFVLDGWLPINLCRDYILFAAFVSPTAIFHVLTGITLVAGY